MLRAVQVITLLALALSSALNVSHAANVVIRNDLPRRDVDGNVMDVHDGCLELFKGRYYLYGTRYGETDGYTKENRYVCYSSGDLTSWTFHGEILQAPPEGVYYRPYVKYNSSTRKYVMWYCWYPTLWDGQYGVATSDVPQGPFVIHHPNTPVRNAQSGDLGLFVDDDGTGYLIYTSIAKGHAISIERLSPDYLSSTLENSGVLARDYEACSLFKRGGIYYALFGPKCCFCPQGSHVRVYTSENPLGPYVMRGNINRNDGGTLIVPAQQTHVATLPSASGTQYIWMGDIWGSRPDGIKGHDLQYWSSPLKFDDDGMIHRLVRENSIEIGIFD